MSLLDQLGKRAMDALDRGMKRVDAVRERLGRSRSTGAPEPEQNRSPFAKPVAPVDDKEADA